MTATVPPGVPAEFEAFGAAVGSAVVAGGLSIVAPFLSALTAALAALAVAGWFSRLHESGSARREVVRSDRLAAAALVGAAVVVFLVPVPELENLKALLLGLSFVPLWLVERRGPGAPRPVGRVG